VNTKWRNITAYQWSEKFKKIIKQETGRETDVFVRFKKDETKMFMGEELTEEEMLNIWDGGLGIDT
jgi:hypothetical protein